MQVDLHNGHKTGFSLLCVLPTGQDVVTSENWKQTVIEKSEVRTAKDRLFVKPRSLWVHVIHTFFLYSESHSHTSLSSK